MENILFFSLFPKWTNQAYAHSYWVFSSCKYSHDNLIFVKNVFSSEIVEESVFWESISELFGFCWFFFFPVLKLHFSLFLIYNLCILNMSSNKRAEKDHIKSSEKSHSFYQLEIANSHLPQNGSPVKMLLVLATGFGVRHQQAWGCSKREDKPRDDEYQHRQRQCPHQSDANNSLKKIREIRGNISL